MANSRDERTNPTSPTIGLRPPPRKQVKGKRHNPNKEFWKIVATLALGS
jgi:hypothetical protein